MGRAAGEGVAWLCFLFLGEGVGWGTAGSGDRLCSWGASEGRLCSWGPSWGNMFPCGVVAAGWDVVPWGVGVDGPGMATS